MKNFLFALLLIFSSLLRAEVELFHGIDPITGKIVVMEQGFDPVYDGERVYILENSQTKKNAFIFGYTPDSTTVEDAAGNRTLFVHDGSKLLSKKVWDAAGALFSDESFTWEQDSLISHTYFNPDRTVLFERKIEINEQSTLVTIQDGQNLYTEKTEYEDSKLVAKTDSLGNSTHYAYNPEGLISAEIATTPEQTTRQFFLYNADGSIQEIIIDDGTGFDRHDFSTIAYRKRIEFIPSMRKPEVVILYRYNPELSIETVEKRIEGVYNEQDKLIYEDFLDIKTDSSTETYFDYDSMGHLTLLHDGFGNGIETSYDQDDHMLRQSLLTNNAPTDSAVYSYDGGELPVACENIDANGGNQPSRYVYNALNQIVASTDSLGNQTEYAYNPSGQLVCVVHPAVLNADDQIIRPTERWIYDSLGRLVSSPATHESPQSTLNPWTPHALPLALPGVIDNATVQIFTDAAGSQARKITVARDCSSLTTYTCDALNRVTEIETLSHEGQLIESEQMRYNAAGQPEKYSWWNPHTQQWISSRWSYGYHGKIESFTEGVSTPLQRTIQYTYDAQNRLETICKPDGVTVTFTYNQDGCLDRLYSSDGTIDQSFEAPETVIKQYDDHNNCVGYVLPDGSAVSYSWENEVLKSIYRLNESGAVLYQINSQDFILEDKAECSETRTATQSMDAFYQLKNYGKRRYEYDVNGNISRLITPNNRLELHYDALDRLTSLSNDEGHAWEYRYDGQNRRVERISYLNEEEIEHDYFLYDGSKEIGVIRDEKIIEFRLLDPRLKSEIGATIAMEVEGEILRPAHDSLNNIRSLSSLDGKKLTSYRYDLWRERGSAQHEIDSPWRFRGKRVDEESGLVFFGRRYYMPHEGRWLTPDPLGYTEGGNRYSYCSGKPQTFQDHYGLFSQTENKEEPSAIYSIHEWVQNHLSFEHSIKKDVDALAHQVFGTAWLIMLGYYEEEAEVGVVGNGELNDSVRVTLINGMLNIHDHAKSTAMGVSKTHADVNVHYIYRPTRGWLHDLIKATWCKLGFFTSHEAELLAQTWRNLIGEMGGPNGGGTIVHYAHSIGAADTFSARLFLPPEEQKMIKVISLGSPLIIPLEGFGSVINYVSLRDGIRILALFAQAKNYVYLDSYWGIPVIDHLMNSGTYKTLMENLGKAFIKEYSKN